ncbi:hypothetical protein [Nocardia sp. NPDC057668]|uniref:hypothetical protein n=1 Tax=Nocardia sp. NPDC057668 TaxID=3346202 RepID=UPI00366F8FAD
MSVGHDRVRELLKRMMIELGVFLVGFPIALLLLTIWFGPPRERDEPVPPTPTTSPFPQPPTTLRSPTFTRTTQAPTPSVEPVGHHGDRSLGGASQQYRGF